MDSMAEWMDEKNIMLRLFDGRGIVGASNDPLHKEKSRFVIDKSYYYFMPDVIVADDNPDVQGAKTHLTYAEALKYTKSPLKINRFKATIRRRKVEKKGLKPTDDPSENNSTTFVVAGPLRVPLGPVLVPRLLFGDDNIVDHALYPDPKLDPDFFSPTLMAPASDTEAEKKIIRFRIYKLENLPKPSIAADVAVNIYFSDSLKDATAGDVHFFLRLPQEVVLATGRTPRIASYLQKPVKVSLVVGTPDPSGSSGTPA